MIGDFLRALWAASCSGGMMILSALLLWLALRDRLPRRVFCLLWDVLLARLLILAEIPSPVSIQNFLPRLFWEREPAAGEKTVVMMAGQFIQRGTAEKTAVPSGAPAPDRDTVLAVLWLAAALALAIWFLWGHLRSRWVYASSLPCRDPFVLSWLEGRPLRRRVQVRTSDRIAAPLTCKILRPIILLPAGMNWTSLSCVLEHEYQHIRHFDTLRKALLAAALCLHWFNPLVYVLYVLANRDMEFRCDEAVVRSGADRGKYALALLLLEEKRGRCGLSGSHFSQNALQERIKTIMKQKHFSWAALAAVLLTMSITGTVFASAPDNRESVPETRLANRHFQAVENDVMILSDGKTGEKQYSLDGGATWISQERYHSEYGGPQDNLQIEWWTAEDYAAWLAEEKQVLQSLIGERGYTSGEGWFTWDQKRVDDAIALYESILEEIKKGALYSKTITDKDGNVLEDLSLGSDGPISASVITTVDDEVVSQKSQDAAALQEELKAFGIGGNANLMTYKGQLIRAFVDGVPVGDNGYSIQYVYTNPDGVVDIHTLRSVIHNPDGSDNPMGDLIGVATKGDKGFDQELIDSATFSASSSGPQATIASGTLCEQTPNGENYAEETTYLIQTEKDSGGQGITFEEIFARYAAYGIAYHPRESGMGALTLNGQSVKSFADLKPDGGAFSYQDPLAAEGLSVYTVYNSDGKLTGLRTK